MHIQQRSFNENIERRREWTTKEKETNATKNKWVNMVGPVKRCSIYFIACRFASLFILRQSIIGVFHIFYFCLVDFQAQWRRVRIPSKGQGTNASIKAELDNEIELILCKADGQREKTFLLWKHSPVTWKWKKCQKNKERNGSWLRVKRERHNWCKNNDRMTAHRFCRKITNDVWWPFFSPFFVTAIKSSRTYVTLYSVFLKTCCLLFPFISFVRKSKTKASFPEWNRC